MIRSSRRMQCGTSPMLPPPVRGAGGRFVGRRRSLSLTKGLWAIGAAMLLSVECGSSFFLQKQSSGPVSLSPSLFTSALHSTAPASTQAAAGDLMDHSGEARDNLGSGVGNIVARSSCTSNSVASARTVKPFEIVRTDLRELKTQIKQLVERHVASNDKTREGSTNPLLQEAAREFFERRERAWRPGTVLLMARALMEDAENQAMGTKQLKLAEIVEMMATAQVIHEDVLEDFDQEEKGNVAHRMYSSELGNKVSLLAGDFLLARASVTLAQLTNVDVVEIIGTSLENMCRGEIMRSWAKVEDKVCLDYYSRMVTMKTASLLADACRCTAILRGDGKDSPIATAAWTFGHNLGVAYCYANDVVTFDALLFAAAGRHVNSHAQQGGGVGGAVSSEILAAIAGESHESVEAALEKASAFGIKDGVLGAAAASGTSRDLLVMMTALPPFAFASLQYPELKDLAMRHFEGDGDVTKAIELLQESDGVTNAIACSKRHADAARVAATDLPTSRYQEGLLAMCDLVVDDGQRGLQRDAYMEQQAKKKEELIAKLKSKGLLTS